MAYLQRRARLIIGMLIWVVGGSYGWAQEGSYQCRQGELLRQVTIVYDVPGAAVPCQVVYSKPTEGAADAILWSAANESGYCEFKARAFRDQLTSWGWACTDPAAAEDMGEEQLGDTDAAAESEQQ